MEREPEAPAELGRACEAASDGGLAMDADVRSAAGSLSTSSASCSGSTSGACSICAIRSQASMGRNESGTVGVRQVETVMQDAAGVIRVVDPCSRTGVLDS